MSQDVDEPRALALDPFQGLMFWTDWGATAKIERALLDGSERKPLVTDRVVWPNGLSLDLERGRVYWVDGRLSSLEYIHYDGSGRQSLLESVSVAMQPFALSVLGDHVYWTDWSTLALYKADMNTLTHAYIMANSSLLALRPLGMKVVHSSLQKQLDNPCLRIQCEGLCVGGTSTQQPRCLGKLISNTTAESEEGDYELTRTAFSDKIQFLTKNSKSLSLAVIIVKCLRREGCVEDERCSQAPARTEVFTAQPLFTVSSLLPATEYELRFITAGRSALYSISTLDSDPPEVPRLTSVEVRGRAAVVKWDPVDTCVPHFQHYNYRLIKVLTGEVAVEGSSNTTEVTLQDLQPGTNYSVQIYTLSPQHFSHINFSSIPEVEERCKADQLLCNGVKDCRDGSDEAPNICARLEEVVVYQKSRSAVFLRCDVANTTRRGLHSFLVVYTNTSTNQTYRTRQEATVCPLWPQSFCFNISNLAPDKKYNFTVYAVLRTGSTTNELSVSATTEEGVSGPPDNVTVLSYTATSVKFQWQRPRQSQGIVRGFLISVFQLETFEPAKCCLDFPVIEQPATPDEVFHSLEIGDLTPASTYAVSVVAKTVFTSSAYTLLVHTSPGPMVILKQPNVLVSSAQPLTWQQQDTPPAESQYTTLITSYLLIVLPPPGAPRLNTSASVPTPLSAHLADSLHHQEFVVLWNKAKDDSQAWLEPVRVSGLKTGLRYQLVWAQVSLYKHAYQLDLLTSNTFVAL